jgi:hypothetical protein
MKQILSLLALIAVPILFLTGYMPYGLTLGFFWFVWRVSADGGSIAAQISVNTELCALLCIELSAEKRAELATAYLQKINTAREKERHGLAWRMSNCGLKKDDPRYTA